jgi:hypothetical protein
MMTYMYSHYSPLYGPLGDSPPPPSPYAMPTSF